jgi:origin recognition complex subunit 4
MEELEPSPRASKRRRTGTYATTKRTVASTPPDSIETVSKTKKSTGKENKKPKESERENAINSADDQEDETPDIEEEEPSSESRLGRKKTAEDEIHEIIATAEAASRTKRSRKIQDGNDEGDEAEPSADDEESAVKPRSSGRKRRPPRYRSPPPEKASSKPASRQSKTQKPTKTTAAAAAAREASTILSPQPKGILTPSRHGRGQRTGPRKSVLFQDDADVEDKDDKQIEAHFGFKDINAGSSGKKARRRFVSNSLDEPLDSDEVFEDAAEFLESHAQQPVDGQDADENEDRDDGFIDSDMLDVEDVLVEPVSTDSHIYPTEDEDPHLTSIKHQVLSRMMSRGSEQGSTLPPIPTHLSTQYASLKSLLTATVTAGESNSLLLLGARGSGKSMLVEHALSELRRSHGEDFHVVALNGFFQTDDKIALREIWRQLGREMAVPEDETGEVSSYADTMASLLSLLSHPEEMGIEDITAMDIDAGRENNGVTRTTSKSVVFILDEFDLFTTHPRQTLLYNLFDIAQAKKAPIAVLGCSTRMDVVDCLEKRVKSRFSHRWLHVPAAKSLVGFEESVRDTLCLPIDGKDALGVAVDDLKWRGKWNEFIKVCPGCRSQLLKGEREY